MDTKRLSDAIVRLVRLAERLRGPKGCPWDAKQTDQSVKNYLLEETYEVLDAVDRTDPDLVCAELGDLLFQIVFLAQLASERGEFDFTDVVEHIEEKMIRRHPHVFGEVKVTDADDVARNWAKIKEEEKEESEGTGQKAVKGLRDVPQSLPALLRAHRLCERASKVNPELEGLEDPLKFIDNALALLRNCGEKAITSKDEDMLGWGLLAFAEMIRKLGKNGEDLLRKANERLIEALESVEEDLDKKGIDIRNATKDQLGTSWASVKTRLERPCGCKEGMSQPLADTQDPPDDSTAG